MGSTPQTRIVKFPTQIKRPKKRKRRFPWTLFVMCIILAYFLYTFSVQSAQLNELLAQERALNDRFQSLQGEIESLKREVELLGTDEYIERLARERLGLVRPQDVILQPIHGE